MDARLFASVASFLPAGIAHFMRRSNALRLHVFQVGTRAQILRGENGVLDGKAERFASILPHN